MSKLQAGKDTVAEVGREAEERRTREELIDILELGALSLLRSLLEDDTEMRDLGDGLPSESDELEIDARSESEVGQHWMREGERDKARERAASEVQIKDAIKLDAMSSSRAQIMHLVQQLPQLNVPLSDGFGSQLISSFLLSGDVDSSLAILNILLRNGGHASDLACESLAQYLLSDGRQAMARAICRLVHSRGRLCDHSFYSFLFASILAPAARISQTPFSSYLTSPVQIKTNRDSTRDFDLRQGIDTEYSDSDDDVEGRSVGALDDIQSMQAMPRGALDMSAAMTDALVLLGEISSAIATAAAAAIATASSGDGPGPLDSNYTREAKWREISINLIEILVRLGYSGSYLETANIAILNLKRSRMA